MVGIICFLLTRQSLLNSTNFELVKMYHFDLLGGLIC
jgi:hypothetical protein